MIYRFACPGHYVDVSDIEDWPSFAKLPARLKSEFLEHHHRDTTFMLHMKNVDMEDRAWTWRKFIESMSNDQAGHLKDLIFYFPQFVLKVHISPENSVRLTYDCIVDYDDISNEASALDPDQITALIRGWSVLARSTASFSYCSTWADLVCRIDFASKCYPHDARPSALPGKISTESRS